MARKPKPEKPTTAPKAIAKWLRGNNEVGSAAEAVFLLITPSEDAPVITVGERQRENAIHALTWAQDDSRFGMYNHPMSDFEHDVHVYSNVDVSKNAAGQFNAPYHEDAATVGADGGWWSADLVKNNSSLVLKLARLLDPVDHSQEVMSRLKAKMVSWDKIEAAMHKEVERAKADYNRIEKHRWGQYHGYGFKIWIAHIRVRAEGAFKIVNELDDKVALEMRGDAIRGKIVRDRAAYIGRNVPRDTEPEGTDTPDFAAEAEAEKPKEEAAAQAVSGLIFPFVKNGKQAGFEVDVTKLEKGTMLYLWEITGSRLVDARWYRNWDPTNDVLIDTLQKFAKKTPAGNFRYGVEFSEVLLPKS